MITQRIGRDAGGCREDRDVLKRIFWKERGATMVEYGLMVALIAVVAIVAVTFLGEEVSTTFNTAAEAMDSVNP